MLQISSVSATSTSPPSAFFDRWADTDTWPEWDEAVRWVRRDGPFAEGTRGSLKPKGGPKVGFVIETLVPDREFTDRSTMQGAALTIRHLVEVLDADAADIAGETTGAESTGGEAPEVESDP